MAAVVAAALLAGAGGSLSAEQEPTIYYFCAESHVDNYAVLKSTFDHYLVPHAGIRFQPVRRWKDFEALIQSAVPAYFIMNGATFANIGPAARLFPVLAGEWHGSLYEHFDLHFGRSVNREKVGEGLVIATSFTVEAAGRIIAEILSDAGYTNAPTFRLLHVPKHLDALIAVRLDQADAALAARETATAFGQTDEARCLRGRPYLRMVVSQRANSEPRPETRALARMHEDPEGAQALQFLRLVRFIDLPKAQEEAP